MLGISGCNREVPYKKPPPAPLLSMSAHVLLRTGYIMYENALYSAVMLAYALYLFSSLLFLLIMQSKFALMTKQQAGGQKERSKACWLNHLNRYTNTYIAQNSITHIALD